MFFEDASHGRIALRLEIELFTTEDEMGLMNIAKFWQAFCLYLYLIYVTRFW